MQIPLQRTRKLITYYTTLLKLEFKVRMHNEDALETEDKNNNLLPII